MYLAVSSHEMSMYTCATFGSASATSSSASCCGTGRTTRPSPMWAQMIVVLGCRSKSDRIWARRYGSCPSFGKGMFDVVVHQRDQAGLAREIEQAVERRVGQARRAARDLGGHELLVDRELADAGEDARER